MAIAYPRSKPKPRKPPAKSAAKDIEDDSLLRPVRFPSRRVSSAGRPSLISIASTLILHSYVDRALAGEIQDIVAIVNNHPNATWTAADSGRFGSFEEAKSLCGMFLKGHPQYKPIELDNYEDFYPVDVSLLADSLDLRTAFPNCKGIGKIRDQVLRCHSFHAKPPQSFVYLSL
jgi:hypothetical protein